MRRNKKRHLFNQFIITIFAAVVVLGCANMQKPQGGPRDRTPPKLLKATPPNQTRNFKAKVVELDFDEYFKLVSQYQEISMSPAQEKVPIYKTSGKSLIITFRDSLRKNTTYVINFGKAIADVNEGNILNNFSYVFSTGPHIDSLSISGKVTNSITTEREKDATVMLIPVKEDSLIFGKKRPSIFANSDTSGNFTLNNLHEGNYFIYALKETAPNKIYDNDAELIAFLKKPIHLTADTSNIQLSLFKQTPEKFRATNANFDADGKLTFVFNRPIINPTVKIIYPPSLNDQKIVEFSATNDTAKLYTKTMDFDSIRVAILENGKGLDSLSRKKGRKEIFKRILSFNYNLSSDFKLKPGSDLTVTANNPVSAFDPTLITLTEDSVSVANFDLQRDTANFKRFYLKYPWKQGSRYELTFNEGAFTSLFNEKNVKSLRRFSIDKPENYGVLTLKIAVPDTSKSYIIELMNEQKRVLKRDEINRTGSLIYRNYLNGKYTVRVTYDDNRNGIWDSGNVKKKRQPENIWILPKQITLRPNWEQEEPVDIPKEQLKP